MHIRIITVNQKLPQWIEIGFKEYLQRFSQANFQLIEVPLEKRNQNKISLAVEKEGEKILSYVKSSNHVVALDEHGQLWSTVIFANHLRNWQDRGQHIDFLIGGPDGLSKACLTRANDIWSLSKLTFPHHLVRLLLMEQLYRAYTILIDHPYHRQ